MSTTREVVMVCTVGFFLPPTYPQSTYKVKFVSQEQQLDLKRIERLDSNDIRFLCAAQFSLKMKPLVDCFSKLKKDKLILLTEKGFPSDLEVLLAGGTSSFGVPYRLTSSLVIENW